MHVGFCQKQPCRYACELCAPICWGLWHALWRFSGERFRFLFFLFQLLASFCFSVVGFLSLFRCWFPFPFLLVCFFQQRNTISIVQSGKSCFFHWHNAVSHIGSKQVEVNNILELPYSRKMQASDEPQNLSKKNLGLTVLPSNPLSLAWTTKVKQITSLENMKSAPTSISSLCHSPPT